MRLPVMPPVSPMLAKLARELPVGDDLHYEPKWDGFRCIVFRDGDEVELGSRNERPLTRYFPEVVAALKEHVPERVVLDGEIVIVGASGLDFDALLQRIHPAASRVSRLAAETPASFVAFDLLATSDADLRPAPYTERRARLEGLLLASSGPVRVTPESSDPAVALDWLDRFEGAGLDGVVAKPGSLAYLEGIRAMTKVKHERTADCVVGGFRFDKDGRAVASLLLGLYDASGRLQHVGVTSSFTAARRRELLDELAPYREGAGEGHPWLSGDEPGRRPGTPSRWSAQRDLSFEPLRPELVCEVAYDHLQGDRFRHGTTFRRFRPDRDARTCRYDQLDVVVPAELSALG